MAKLVKTAMDAPLTLEDLQRIMGLLNDFGKIVSVYDGFRFSLNKFLARISEHTTEARLLPHQAAQELRIWGLLQPTQQLTACPYSQAANTFPGSIMLCV